MYPYSLQGDNLTILIDYKHHTLSRGTHPNFDKVIEAIKTGDWQAIPDLVDLCSTVAKYVGGVGSVVVKNGAVYYQNQPIHNALVDRIMRMIEQGFSPEPMLAFLDNLMQNPSKTAVDELYLFLEQNTLPITPDGHFLAYKRVRDDYKDIHSGKVDNSVGARPEMRRNEVDDNRSNTCSRGLHFCSLEYLPHFGTYGGSRVMILKINPADVVSIPSDYNNSKGRTWRYEVVAEHTTENLNQPDEAFDRAVDDRFEQDPPRVTQFVDTWSGKVTYRYDNGTYASTQAYVDYMRHAGRS